MERAADRFLKMIGSKNWRERCVAAYGLGQFLHPEGPTILAKCLEDGHPQVAYTAAIALGHYPKSRQTIETLMRALDFDAARYPAALLLARYGDAEACELLLQVIRTEQRIPKRYAAIIALGYYRGQGRVARELSALLDDFCLDPTANRTLLSAVIQAIGEARAEETGTKLLDLLNRLILDNEALEKAEKQERREARKDTDEKEEKKTGNSPAPKEPELENLSFLQHDLLVTLAQLSKNISRKVLVFSQQSYRHLVHTMRILEMARLGLPEVRVFLEDIAVDQSDQEIRRRALLLLDYYDMRYSPVNRLMAIPKNAKFQEEVLREREQRFPRVMQEVRKDFTVFQQEQQPLLESSMFWKTLDRYEKELPPEDYARRKNLISRFEDLMFTQGEASREVEVTLLLQDDLNALFNKKPKQEEK